MLPTLFNEYLWYHAFTLVAISIIISLILVHRRGS